MVESGGRGDCEGGDGVGGGVIAKRSSTRRGRERESVESPLVLGRNGSSSE